MFDMIGLHVMTINLRIAKWLGRKLALSLSDTMLLHNITNAAILVGGDNEGGQFLLTSPDPSVVDPGQEGLAGFRLRQLLQHRQEGLLCPFEVHAPPAKETTVT